MTRRQYYKVQLTNGRFQYIAGTKQVAIHRAQEMLGGEFDTTEQELIRDWGVTITRVSQDVARSTGIY